MVQLLIKQRHIQSIITLTISCTLLLTYLATCVGCSSSSSSSGSGPPGGLWNFWYGWNYENLYDQLDKYLAKNFSSSESNFDVIMETGIQWLELKESNSFVSPKRRILHKVLKQLKALRSMKHDQQCDLRSYKILLANDKATRGQAHKSKAAFNSKRLIDKTVQFYFLKHASSCRKVYLKLIQTKLDNMDRNKLRMVERIANGFIHGNIKRLKYPIFRPERKNLYWRKIDPLHLRRELMGGNVYVFQLTRLNHSLEGLKNPLDLLLDLSQLDPSTPSTIVKQIHPINGEAELRELYVKHMLEPCDYYIRELSDYHTVISYDYKTKNIYPRKKESNIEFYIHRASFRICQDLINRIRRPLLTKLVQSLNQKNHLSGIEA